MAGHRVPGPLGMGDNTPEIDSGTMALTASPLPSPIGTDAFNKYLADSGQGGSRISARQAWDASTQQVQKLDMPTQQFQTSEGGSRRLTSGEIAMARLIFKDSIDYSKVKVHNGEYLWFGLQPDDTAMTPNGEMYFNSANFKEDFSISTERFRRWFMHEMVHVWQHQLGYPVKWRGAIRVGLPYEYTLDAGKNLGDYNMEAQGDIVADYFAHTVLKRPQLIEQKSNRDPALIPLYQAVLAGFLANPSDKKSLPK